MGMTVVIAGGSGFLGQNLARYLIDQDRKVVLLSRSEPQSNPGWTFVPWDGENLGDWADCLHGAQAVVNLAGRSVDCIKNADNRRQIFHSRVRTTEILGEAVRRIQTPPPTWVQMSTAHIYGDPPSGIYDEESELGEGLAPDVGRAWEAAFAKAVLPQMRQVILRTSFVLGRSGGAVPRMASLARKGLGGRAGHGRQGISWLHELDMNRLFVRAIDDPNMSGMYVATAPNPVSNAEFMAAMRSALAVRIGLPALSWMVRIGAPLLMKTDPELALLGRYCVSKRLADEGFEFKFSQIQPAMNDVLA